MPDTLISTEALASQTAPTKRCAKKRNSGPAFGRPTEFVDRIIEAIKPALDEEGEFESTPALVQALMPIMADFTVADAVYAIAMLHTVNATLPAETVDGKDCPILNGLFRVNDLLQDFASFAWATSKHCAAARAKLMEKSTDDGEWEVRFPSALARSIRHDMSNLVSGHFGGETFTSVQRASGLPLWLLNVVEARDEEFDSEEWRGKLGVPAPFRGTDEQSK